MIETIDHEIELTFQVSIDDAIKSKELDHYRLVIVNTNLLGNSRKNQSKLSAAFNKEVMVGFISGQYDRELSDLFSDSIFINDKRDTILNIVKKHIENNPNCTCGNERNLSEREIDVLKLLAEGKSNKEIAEELYISIHTVISHRKNISCKLGVKSTAALVIYAVANEIIDVRNYTESQGLP